MLNSTRMNDHFKKVGVTYFEHVQQVHSSWLLDADAEQEDVVEQDGYEEEHRMSEASVVEEAPLLVSAPAADFELVLLFDASFESPPQGLLKSWWLLLNVLSMDFLLYRQLVEEQPAKAVGSFISDNEVLDFIHWSQEDTMGTFWFFSEQIFIRLVFNNSRNLPDLDARINLWALISSVSNSTGVLLLLSVVLASLLLNRTVFKLLLLLLLVSLKDSSGSLFWLNGDEGDRKSDRLVFWEVSADEFHVLSDR